MRDLSERASRKVETHLYPQAALENRQMDRAEAPFMVNKRELPAYWEITGTNINGVPSKRLMVVLRTGGCAHNKCTMCGFRNSSIPGITSIHLKRQINLALLTVDSVLPGIEYISILGLGSFFDQGEIPVEARNYILKRVSQIDSIKKVQVESRVDYITAGNLKTAQNILRNKKFEVAIGIESSNERIRNKILKKDLSWDELRKKLHLFKKTNTALLAYILVKPPNLTEEDAVEDAVKSSRDIVSLTREVGIDVNIALEPTFVVSGTPLEKEYLAGRYRPINLWHLLEIIKRVHHLCPVFIGTSNEGLVDDNIIPGAWKIPYSCPYCQEILQEKIQEFNHRQDVDVFSELYCEFCQKSHLGK